MQTSLDDVAPSGRPARAFWLVAAALSVLIVAVDVWIATAPIDGILPEGAEPAAAVDLLVRGLAMVAAAIFIYVGGFLLYFINAFRRDADEPLTSVGANITGLPRLEATWTILPAILMALLGIFSFRIWAIQQNTRGDALTILVAGHQYFFEFRYPGLHKAVAGTLLLPVGVPTTVELTSTDVLHDIWIPEFRVKADLVPGLVTQMRIVPNRIGTYRIVCAEFCGINHGIMQAHVAVVSRADFEAWFDRQRALESTTGEEHP